ncbi:hypothetical protein ACOMHN_026608 [Nucella lapillus]
MKEDTGGKKEWKDGMEEDRGKKEWKDGMEEHREKKEWKDGIEEDRERKERKDGMEEDRKKEERKDEMKEDRKKEERKDGSEEHREKKERKDGMEEDRGKEEGKDGMEEDRGKEEGMEEMVDDVQFKGRGQEPTQSFMPTTAAWRMQQSRRLALPAPTTLPERQAKGELGIPTKVDNIVGDGNCLYRALSFEVCGTQEYHENIRALIVDMMCRHEKAFSAYVRHDLGEYICHHALPAHSWGSDVEIFAAATLLQTTVVVYTAISPTSRKWLSHPPLFPLPGIEVSKHKIYLRNLCQHFERVVSVA